MNNILTCITAVGAMRIIVFITLNYSSFLHTPFTVYRDIDNSAKNGSPFYWVCLWQTTFPPTIWFASRNCSTGV